jgi:hypothetical protein
MPEHSTSLPIFYLKATDARFFEALWRNCSAAERDTFVHLRTLADAQHTHRVQILSEQKTHTADVCWTLTEQRLPSDLGFAPLLAAHAGIAQAHNDVFEKSPARWMRLTPVYWAAARDHVNLHEIGGDDVDFNDWAQIVQTITPWLTELGWTVFVQKREAFIRVEAGFDYHAPSLALAQSDILERFLPQGADLKHWQRLLTELQMLLHSHPVNAARAQRGAPPINSFWLDQSASASHIAPELLSQTQLFTPEIPVMDYDISLAQLAQYFRPMTERLNAGKNASLRILCDQPDACVHEFEFIPATLWQKLKAKFNRKQPITHPFAWLTPAFDEDSL